MKIKPCPCGYLPEKLGITENGQGTKWAVASCPSCGYWEVEFRTGYYPFDSDECQERAITVWNEAPRGFKYEA